MTPPAPAPAPTPTPAPAPRTVWGTVRDLPAKQAQPAPPPQQWEDVWAGAERPPEPRVPEPWERPVPETWSEWTQWWGERQAHQVTDWWQQAEKEVWTEGPPEISPGIALTKQVIGAWQKGIEAAERAKEKLTLSTAVDLALKTAGIIVTPLTGALEAAKAVPGLFGAGARAIDQATRGVTGAIVGGLDVIDVGLMEQGLLGVGAEIVAPFIKGHHADFTPQEFEAGRNRYTRWWTHVSQGEEAAQELYDLTMEEIKTGAQPEDIDASAALTSPIAELAGRLILDPLNLIPGKAGAAARMSMSKEAAAKIYKFEDVTDYTKILDGMKAEGALTPATAFKRLHPKSLDNASLAGQWSERAAITLAQALEGSADPGDFGRTIRAFIDAGGEGDVARVAQAALRKKLGGLGMSRAGKETTLLMRELLTTEEGVTDLAKVAEWMKGKTDQQVLKNMLGDLDKTLQRIYPHGKVNPAKFIQNKYRTFLTKYMYMGWNPGYAIRNGISNVALTTISGYNPLSTAETIGTFAKRWGGLPFDLRKGYGGPASEYIGLAMERALEKVGSEYNTYRLKDLTDDVMTELATQKLRGAPAMRLSEGFETLSGERIIKQALERFWKEQWTPRLPPEVRAMIPTDAQATALEKMLGDVVNTNEFDGVLATSVLGRSIPDELEELMAPFPSKLRDEVWKARLESADAETFAARMDEVGEDVNQWLREAIETGDIELGKNDELVRAVLEADREMIEGMTEAEAAVYQGVQDAFAKQLSIDRGKELAYSEKLDQLTQASDDIDFTKQVGAAQHQSRMESIETRRIVDEQRGITLGELALPGADRSAIWDEYFAFRDRAWRKYWDGWEDTARRLMAGDKNVVTPELVEELAARATELTKEFTPTRYAIAQISAMDTQEVLGKLGEAGRGMNWGDMPAMSDETQDAIQGWIKQDLTPRFHTSKALANKVAMNERDFVLFNYSRRTNWDNALSYLYPYHYWYSRAAINVPQMLIRNPKVLDAYVDYKDAVHQLNEEAKGLPWWENQIRVPGTDYYLNLEATLNPLYSMITDFHDPERTATTQGQVLERLSNLGPSLDAIYWAAYAAWRSQQDEPEEALAAMGYLGQPTKAIRYATAFLGVKGGKGITLEPWLWDDAWSFEGLDKWERRRIGYHLKDMVDEGAATEEQVWDAGHQMSGPAWDEAVARMTAERGLGPIASLLFGIGFKPRRGWEMEIDKALMAEREFYAHAETAYDMGTDSGIQAYKEAQRNLYATYPFLSFVKLTRRGEMERDSTYTREVLNRMPPGDIGYAIKEQVGLTDATVDLFYSTRGDFETWDDIDRANFMAKVEALGRVLGVPEDFRRKEWDTARRMYADVKDQLRVKYGDDIFDLQDLYYETKRYAGSDAANAFLEQNENLGDMWDDKNAAVVGSEVLTAYWGSLEDLDNFAKNIRYDTVLARFPDYFEANAEYNKDFPRAQWKEKNEYKREYLKANPWLKDAWDLNGALKDDLEDLVEDLTARMKPPLGPVLRPDTNLASVLTQDAKKLIDAKYRMEEMIRGPRAEQLDTTPPPPIGAGVEPDLTEQLDVTDESVVKSVQPTPTGAGRVRPPRAAATAAIPTPPPAPPEAEAPTPTKKAITSKDFSWQTLKDLLGNTLSQKLVGHLLQGFPLSEALKSRLEEIYQEFPLGLADLSEWIKFVRLMWRASNFPRGGSSYKGMAQRPRPLLGTRQPGAGYRFTPWG